ncbi:alanyl-tRNA editing protein [Candidatus Woesearchaeota archaeon]|nr:alanyl-tRNA editing protein [Candidatus Woesearchaeota archaeon]
MDEALYLKDHELRSFEAVVKKAEGTHLILDQTAFYPTSGGQPFDTGKILRGDEIFNVLDVKKSPDGIIHMVDREGLHAGDTVQGEIDWNRRYKLMRMHTGAHIICQVIHKQTGALITGNQLGIEESRIDFALDNYNQEMMQQYINEANGVVARDLPITFEFKSREEAMKIPQLSKLAMGLPPQITTVRILSIGDFDVQADGGTHVASTKEVGKIVLVKCENKGKNNRRLYYRLDEA